MFGNKTQTKSSMTSSRVLESSTGDSTAVSSNTTAHPASKAPSPKMRASSLAESLISSFTGNRYEVPIDNKINANSAANNVIGSLTPGLNGNKDSSLFSWPGNNSNNAAEAVAGGSLTDPGMSPPTTKAPRSALSLKTGSLDAVLLLEGADEVLLHKCSSGLVAEQDDESLDSPESAQSGKKSKVSFFLDTSSSGVANVPSLLASASSLPTSGGGNGPGVKWQDSVPELATASNDDNKAFGRSHTIAIGELQPSSKSAPGQLNRPVGIKSTIAAAFAKLAVAVDGDSTLRRTEPETPGTQALHYKQHHGYLPSRAPSFAGNGVLAAKGAERVSLHAESIKLSRPGASEYEDSSEGETSDEDSSMPALPPGAVPAFGPPATNRVGSSSTSASAIAAAADGAQELATAPRMTALATIGRATSSKQQQLLPSKSFKLVQGPANSSIHQRTSYLDLIPKSLSLAPANTPEPVLLAVNPRLPPKLQRDDWCLDEFVLHKRLYDGYASTIYKAMDRRSGQVVALKLYHMNKLNAISSHQVAREVRLHIGLDHENIISLYVAFQEAGEVVLVQEFAGGGDLWQYIDVNSGRLSERATVSLVLQPFLKSLQYLHFSGIIHRDIKPENVLFTSNMVLKVADFGLAVSVREERAVTRVGTLDYMAPEVLRCPLKRTPVDNKNRADLHYSQAVDAWAVGVLAYELLTGRAPFSAVGASDQAIEVAIMAGVPVFPSRMSDPAVDFISVALNKTPSKRPTILQLLQHTWIRSFQRSSSQGRVDSMSDSGLASSSKQAPQSSSMLSSIASKFSTKKVPIVFDDSAMTGYGSGTC